MNVQTMRPRRPKLSLPFGGRNSNDGAPGGSSQSCLPDHELRRIVAGMIG
ncbi:MAG TPA: hypothetical protein VF662_09015 [Allosphingosinicella sp.]|jgi:hypothetical protein